MRYVLFAFLFLLSGLSAAQEVPSEGSIIKERIVLGRSTFALPPGEWRIAATSSGEVTTTGGGPKLAGTLSAYLVQLDAAETFIAALFYRVPTSSVRTTSWNDPLCERKDTLFRDAFSGRFDFPECLLINHSVPFWVTVPTAEFDRKIWDWYQKNKVKLPGAAVTASYRKYFSGDYVHTSIAVNPEFFGQDHAIKAVWADSEWHPSMIKGDAKRQAFVERFKKWSYVMADNAKATLMDRKPKAASLPSLEELKTR